MIGNDVIDLNAARSESNWKRPGLLKKLFSDSEQEIISDSDKPENIVWVLWSMKEAAYKIYNRQTGTRGFIPHKIICSDIQFIRDSFSGSVSCNNNLYHATGIISHTLIHTVCTDGSDKAEFVKTCTKSAILKDSNNLPYVMANGLKRPASVSHHGKFYKAVYRTDIII